MISVKKSLGLFLLSGIALLAFNGCKKGENDPGLSLSSRKARLAGEWKLSKMTKTTVDASGSETYTYDGTSMTLNSGGVPTTWTYSLKYTFEKDGTFKKDETTAAGTTSVTGVWAWGGKNKGEDIKSKETVILSYKTQTSGGITTTWTGSFSGDDALQIDRLAGKEMVILLDATSVSTPAGGTASTSTTTGTMTFAQ